MDTLDQGITTLKIEADEEVCSGSTSSHLWQSATLRFVPEGVTMYRNGEAMKVGDRLETNDRLEIRTAPPGQRFVACRWFSSERIDAFSDRFGTTINEVVFEIESGRQT